jgi:anti-anti-sigma factor
MPDQIQRLIDKLKSSDRDVVRTSVIEEIGKFGDPRAIRPLIDALSDEDTLVRWNAVQALARFGDDALAQLFVSLESGDRFIRRNVVQALGEIGGDETIDRLIRMLMFDESDKNVLVEVIKALNKINADRAVEPLLTVLKMNDWEMKWRAINALGKIGDPKAIEPLLEAINDEDPDIRWAANLAIENIKKISVQEEVDPATAIIEAPAPAPGVPPSAQAASELNMATSKTSGWMVVHIKGDIVSSNASTFRGFIEGVIASTAGSIEIDLHECKFIDSFALSQFNMIRKKLKAKNRSLKLTGLNPNIRAVFETTKLDELFVVEG